jgi:hypothetical protein
VLRLGAGTVPAWLHGLHVWVFFRFFDCRFLFCSTTHAGPASCLSLKADIVRFASAPSVLRPRGMSCFFPNQRPPAQLSVNDTPARRIVYNIFYER